MKRYVFILAASALSFVSAAQIKRNTVPLQKNQPDTSGKGIIPGNKVPVQPPPVSPADSLRNKIQNLEERLLALEAKTPYSGMNIAEVEATAANLLARVSGTTNFTTLKIDNPLCNGNPSAEIFVKATIFNPVESVYYENGYWYIRFLCIKIYKMENLRVEEYKNNLGNMDFTVFKRDNNIGFVSAPVFGQWHYLKPGDKITILIFTRFPSKAVQVGGKI